MLMMLRRQGEVIRIGEEIRIHIAHIGRSRVRLAISAPRELRVVAEEVEMVERQNRAAAASLPGTAISAALARLARNRSSSPTAVR